MDRLRGMEVFMRVVEDGSFVRAAEALNVSRPMASKRVQNLEEALGARLLNRTTRRVSLTEAGRSFYTRCREIFSQIDEAVAEAGNLQSEARGLIRLSAPYTFGERHLTPALADFQSRFPEISIDLSLNDRQVDIVDEGFDLVVRIGTLSDSSLVGRKLAPCRMLLCASPDYLERRGHPGHPDDLKDHNCIVYAYFSEAKAWRFRKNEEQLDVAVGGDFRSNYGAAGVEAAVAGRGIVLEPTFIAAEHIQSGALVPLLRDWQTTTLGIHAVYPQSRLLPQKVRVLIDDLIARLGPVPHWDRSIQNL